MRPALESGTPRWRRRSALGLLLLGSAAAGAALFLTRAGNRSPERHLEGRLGGKVEVFDAHFVPALGGQTGLLRRIYTVGDGRLLVDLTAAGRVRQLTVGRERSTNELWQPDPGDESLEQARRQAAAWLPGDATHRHSEPFAFREQPGGMRDIYVSAALGALLPADVYAQHNASGPPGLCAVTYYQTTTGGVAFYLVGIL